MTKSEVESVYCGTKCWYFGFHIFVLGIYLLYDNPLKLAIVNLQLWYPLMMIILDCIVTYYYFTVRQNPGYLKDYLLQKELHQNNDDNKLNIISISLDEAQAPKNQEDPTKMNDSNLSTQLHLANPLLQNMQNSITTAEDDTSKYTNINETLSSNSEYEMQSNVLSENKNSNTNNEQVLEEEKEFKLPDKHYCEECKKIQPYRTKHCYNCDECVCKFDHHCFWIGGCVGELNHRRFWLMLFFMTIQYTWAFIISWEGMEINNINNLEYSPDEYSKQYGAFFATGVITFLSALLVHILFWYHTYLLMAGLSTWEQQKKSSLSYLAPYPKGYNPFGRGIALNLKMAFFHGEIFTNWELPDIKMVKEEKSFNWCENEYWSCCQAKCKCEKEKVALQDFFSILR